MEKILSLDNPFHLFEINRSYVHETLALPPVPQEEVDFNQLSTLLSKIDWKKHMPCLRQRLENDQHFKANHKGEQTDDFLKEYIEKMLRIFIDNIVHKSIEILGPQDYGALTNYLKIVTRYITQDLDPKFDEVINLLTGQHEVEIVEKLFTLAIVGQYCGPAQIDMLETMVVKEICGKETFTLREKILHLLYDQRETLMQGIYLKEIQPGGGYYWEEFKEEYSEEGTNMYNGFLYRFGLHLGLATKLMKNSDDFAVKLAFFSLLATSLSKQQVHEKFWKRHTLEKMCDAIASIGRQDLPQIHGATIQEWWSEWIGRQDISFNQKNTLIETLEDKGTLLNIPLQQGAIRGPFDPRFIVAMLFDMGILNEKSPQ